MPVLVMSSTLGAGLLGVVFPAADFRYLPEGAAGLRYLPGGRDPGHQEAPARKPGDGICNAGRAMGSGNANAR